jgi:hypothetical protein
MGFNMEPGAEWLAVPPNSDLFSVEPASSAADEPVPRRREGASAPRPTAARLVVAGVVGLFVAWLFGMPLLPNSSTALVGVALPVGTLFASGLVGLQALRARRTFQQLLRPPVAALFFAFGFPLLLAPFPPDVRYVFYLVMIGATVALYEWSMPD